MNELAQELKAVGQSMPYPQIKESLEALQGSKLSFKYSATDTKNSDIDDSFYESNMNFYRLYTLVVKRPRRKC